MADCSSVFEIETAILGICKVVLGYPSPILVVIIVLRGCCCSQWLVGRSKVFSNHPPPISVDVDVLDGGCCSRWLVVVAVSVDDV